jgi:hypothetical protein
MRKCNVSVSTAKKGESIQAIGIGNCKITTQTANGELVNLILHDVLYVPDARRNLLSVSKLAQDRFQVVLPADNSIFRPGIYNCRKSKSSVEQSIPIIPVGTLFHVQTCADAEIKRHDRVENKWICWHRRLGYMPLATIQQMINSCQGLDDLQGIAMPRNYISANVRMGKATNLDQPSSNPTRAERPMQIVHFDLFWALQTIFFCRTFLLWRICRRSFTLYVGLYCQEQIRSTRYLQKVLRRYSYNSQQEPTLLHSEGQCWRKYVC